MSDLTFAAMREDEIPAVARIVSLAFAGPRESTTDWIAKAGVQHFRVLRPSAGDPVACLLRIPMGEFFGGRSIPMIGIAGVGVAPEGRGKGVAGQLMTSAVLEMHAEGVPLSGLYPATQPLYQRIGYEQAGHRFEIKMSIRSIDVKERSLAIRPITDADERGIRACYSDFARAHDGLLDRGEYIWARVKSLRDVAYAGFAAVDETGRIEGYLYLNQQRRPEGTQDISLTDFVFTTPRAGRRLWAFLEDFSSIAIDLTFFGGPLHPALHFLAEQRFTSTHRLNWMLRIVDVKKCLEARGYSGSGRAEVHLDIRDETIPANAGPWIVTVEGGRAIVERGGRGDLRLSIRALAPLFSGYLSAAQLAQLGRIEGSSAAIAAAAGVFPAGTPWLSDMY
jgi:predicted acetyltransferase